MSNAFDFRFYNKINKLCVWNGIIISKTEPKNEK